MTQIRPRIDPDLAADVKAYGDSLGLSFNLTVRILLRIGLTHAPRRWDDAVAALASPDHDAGSTT